MLKPVCTFGKTPYNAFREADELLAPVYRPCIHWQRWSRGHKARGQGQGHKKNPRPRTAFSRTEPLEAKDRNARGQGPRTQAQAFSKKKRSSKFFFRQSPNSLAYPEF